MKFKVGDKVRVIDIGVAGLPIGTKAKVIEVVGNNDIYLNKPNASGSPSYYPSNKVELIKSKNQRITALEETVAKQGEEIEEIKLIIAQIRKPSTDVEEVLKNDIIEFEGKQYKKVEREARLPFDYVDEPYEPTPNELRAEIIEKAKAFVDESKTNVTGVVEDVPFKGQFRTFESIYEVKLGTFSKAACNVEFIVNEEKRTAVALLRGVGTNKVYARGIAKCIPYDVFNEHIGKAIALGRALGLDVSEFEHAVQPTIPVVGMVVEYFSGNRTAKVMPEDANFVDVETETYLSTARMKPTDTKIINDTNAIYEVN